jgi:hypothetical protein
MMPDKLIIYLVLIIIIFPPQPPAPPEPLILHLGVLAQTFSIPDYAALYNDLDSFFIDRQSLVGQTPAITADVLPVKVTTEEEALLGNVLNQMIRYNSRKINFDDLLILCLPMFAYM